MKNAPEVSIVMSVHNDAQRVGMAIESILAQTHSSFELVVIDDGSNDDTQAVLRRFNDPRMRVSRNEWNIGLTRSLNRGIALCRGRYIARMDSDDLSVPERIERQYRYLESHPDIGVLGSAVRGMDAAGKVGNIMGFPSSHEEIVWNMLFECAVAHPTVMLRKQLLDRYGVYNTEYIYAQDVELWCRLAPVTRFANLKEPLLTRRWHADSIGSQKTSAQLEFGMRARQNLIEHYARRSIPYPVMEVLSRWSGRGGGAVSTALCEAGTSLLFELYEARAPIGGACPGIRAGIRKDMVRRVLSLARSSAWNPRMLGCLAARLRHDKAHVVRLSFDYLLEGVR